MTGRHDNPRETRAQALHRVAHWRGAQAKKEGRQQMNQADTDLIQTELNIDGGLSIPQWQIVRTGFREGLGPRPARPLARKTDPPTSHAAAAAMTTRRLTALQEKIAGLLGDHPGGMISEEMSDLMPGTKENTINPRMKPMEERGIVRRCGTRLAKTGRQQIVWDLL